MAEERSFLGKGWAFPPAFDRRTGNVLLVKEEEDVSESLQILLATRQGERVMQPGFGCNLDIMLFEPLTTTLITVVKDLIQTAILYYEPRVDLDRITIKTENETEGIIFVELDYTVRASNSRFNLVYPFYLEEGTDVNLSLQSSFIRQ